MKRFILVLAILMIFIGKAFSVPVYPAKDIDFTKYEVIKSNKMETQDALNLIKYIELDTPFFEQLLDNGYFDVKFDDGTDGVWFLFVNEGTIHSFQMQIIDAEKGDFIFGLKEWKVK